MSTKTPTPFCCNILEGSEQERNEFMKMLYKYDSSEYFAGTHPYYGIDREGRANCEVYFDDANNLFTRILPLSEGIAILKEMVGEETKPEGDYVTLPRKLTAENGAKGLLIGEFKESVHFTVDGEENKIDVDVSWTTIKAIYDMIVENLQPKP